MTINHTAPINGYSGTYAHRGNDKLGHQVSTINREAGATCPGESEFCKGCYAKKGVFAMYDIQSKYRDGIISVPMKLRALPNVQLFASVDKFMPNAPDGWRVAFRRMLSPATYGGMPPRRRSAREKSTSPKSQIARRAVIVSSSQPVTSNSKPTKKRRVKS